MQTLNMKGWAAPHSPKLSDERIDELIEEYQPGCKHSYTIDFARAIEREILGQLGMTRDDIIRMAKEAGLYSGNPRTPGTENMIVNRLQRFAELVAAAEREECAATLLHSAGSPSRLRKD